MRNLRVIVTGGSGFIGTNLVARHLELGDQVWNLDTVAPRDARQAGVWRRVDLCDAAASAAAIGAIDPHVIYHMAARTDLRGSSVADYRANTVGISNLLQALARSSALRLVVFASSMLVCRAGYRPQNDRDYCPGTAYGESKVVGERIVRESAAHVPWIIVRPTSIWGPWFGTPYRDFFDVVRRGFYVHPRGSHVQRSYGYVGNTVHQLVRLAELDGGPLARRTVYLADFEPLDVRQWADTIAREFGVRPIREVPIAILRAGALAGDLLQRLGLRAALTTFRLDNMLTEMIHDVSPLQALCGQLPYTTQEGVRATCNWMRSAD